MLKMLCAGALGLVLAGSAVLGAGANDDARVRVIHASPDAPNVDVYANGDQVLSDVPFGESSGYLTVPAGAYNFEVYAAGSNPDTDDAVLSVDATVAASTDYTVVATNEVASLEAGLFEDNNSAPAQGQAHIYVIHAGPDAPAVDIAAAGSSVLIDNLNFGERAGPLPVDAGTYDLEVRPAGTEDVALPLDGVSLERGKIYTFVATGFLEGTPELTVLAFAEDPAPSTDNGDMAPPSAGSAGLLDRSSGGSSNTTYLYGAAAVLIGLIVAAGLVRQATHRS